MTSDLTAPVPAGWVRPPVYARFSVQLGKMLDEKRITGTHLAPYLRNVDVQWNGVNVHDLPVMDFGEADRDQFSLCSGDLLVCEGGEVGRTSIWLGELKECFFQKAIHRLRPTSNRDDPRFFRYFMRMAVESGLFSRATASTIQHLPAEKLRVVRYGCPPRETQTAIADYLDRETARLDALVSAKERVIGLLGEKRHAVISVAVTRGLDASARMKPSDIQWLGDVPTHWTTWKTTHAFRTIRSGTTPKSDDTSYYDGDVPWVTTSELRERVITDTGKKVTAAAIRDYATLRMYPPGTLLFAMYGATIGRLGILGVSATVNQACAAFTGALHLDAKFTYYWLLARRATLIALSTGGGQPNLSQEDLRQLRIPAPELPEQRSIVEFLDDETAKLDALLSATERSIVLIRERRTALISAAVTGALSIA